MKNIIKYLAIFISGFAFTQPLNDDCSGAVDLSPSDYCFPISGDVSNATQSLAGCSGTADNDVWYQFTATKTTHKIQVVGSTDFDAVFELFEGNCGTLSSLDCVDNSFAGDEENLEYTNFTIGQTYFIRVSKANLNI